MRVNELKLKGDFIISKKADEGFGLDSLSISTLLNNFINKIHSFYLVVKYICTEPRGFIVI